MKTDPVVWEDCISLWRLRRILDDKNVDLTGHQCIDDGIELLNRLRGDRFGRHAVRRFLERVAGRGFRVKPEASGPNHQNLITGL